MHSRHLPALGICLLIGAFVGCTPASVSSPARDARLGETRARATAEEVYRSYIDASNAIDLADPETFEPVAEFTSRRFYADLLASFNARHRSGQVIRGKIAVESFRVQSVLPDLGVEATVCLDMSRVTVVDRHGESVLAADSPDFLASYAEFRSVDGELLLDGQFIEPIEGCLTTGSTSRPAAPVPGAPGTPAPDGRSREQDESCVSYPGGVTICGGGHG